MLLQPLKYPLPLPPTNAWFAEDLNPEIPVFVFNATRKENGISAD